MDKPEKELKVIEMTGHPKLQEALNDVMKRLTRLEAHEAAMVLAMGLEYLKERYGIDGYIMKVPQEPQ